MFRYVQPFLCHCQYLLPWLQIIRPFFICPAQLRLLQSLLVFVSTATVTSCASFQQASDDHVGTASRSLPLSAGAQRVASDKSDLRREERDWKTLAPKAGTESIQPDETLYDVNAVDLPLYTLLFSLAEVSGHDLSIAKNHQVPVTLQASGQPMESILDIVTQQAGLRWSLANNRIDVTDDIAYLESYTVDYLNISRQSRSSVGLATRVGSIALDIDSTGESSGFSNSSRSIIENHSSHEFWESLQRDLEHLLNPQGDGLDASVGGTVVINRDTGMVTVYASAALHKQIRRFLNSMQSVASRQVMIEATVVEVTLSDSFQAGVDWSLSASGETGLSGAQSFHGQSAAGAGNTAQISSPAALLSAIHQSNSIGRIAATLDLLESFGQVKILSRPQIIAINNQSAVLKVVDNRVYFTMSVERQSSESNEAVRTATDIHTVPVGLVMSVTPHIGSDNTVMLSVRPTISRIIGFVNDPNPELAAANVRNGVPEIQVREMESVLRVGDGEIAMIGGLMQSQRSSSQDAVPWFSNLPVIGKAFQQHRDSVRKTELLVFLQPTVIGDAFRGAGSETNYRRGVAAAGG